MIQNLKHLWFICLTMIMYLRHRCNPGSSIPFKGAPQWVLARLWYLTRITQRNDEWMELNEPGRKFLTIASEEYSRRISLPVNEITK